jgi:hypothetical protein
MKVPGWLALVAVVLGIGYVQVALNFSVWRMGPLCEEARPQASLGTAVAAIFDVALCPTPTSAPINRLLER